MKRWILSCTVAAILSAAAADAHHSISGVYDSSKQVTIEGVVSQFRFVNPHPFVMVDVTDQSGQVQQWQLEMDNRRELADIGVKMDTIKPGDRVVVTGSLAFRQARSLYIRQLERPADGFKYQQVGFSPRISRGAAARP